MDNTMKPADWLMLLTLSLLWGGSFFFVEIAVPALPTLTIVSLRVGLAALVLWAVLLLGERKQLPPFSLSVWLAFAGMSVLNNLVPFSLIVWGQAQISGGLAAILVASTPLFAVVVVHFSTNGERINRRRLAGAVIGFCGVIWMLGGDIQSGLGDNIIAQLAMLAAAVSYAFAGLFGVRFRAMGLSPMMTACGQVTASAIILTPIALFLEQPWTLAAPDFGVWAAIGSLAVFSTALAYILYFRILSSAGATNITLVTFLVPASAIGLGFVFLDEQLLPRHFFGMALIGAGLHFIGGKKS